MWPFKNKQASAREKALVKIQVFGDLGDRFVYLGRSCVINAHWAHVPNVGKVPMLCANYADNDGVIHDLQFAAHHLPALLKQQPHPLHARRLGECQGFNPVKPTRPETRQ